MNRFIQILLLFFILSRVSMAQSTNSNYLDACGLLWGENYAEATEVFTGYISQSYAPVPESYLKRGESYFWLGEYKNALGDFEQAAGSRIPEAWLWRARCFGIQNETDKGIHALNQYLNAFPGTDLNEIRKDTCFRSFYGTEKWFALLEEHTLSESATLLADATFHAGRGNFVLARQIIEKGLNSEPVNVSLLALNAEIYAKEGIPELALNEINRALSVEPGSRDFLERKVRYLLLLKDYQSAYRIQSTLVDNYPYRFDARLVRLEIALDAKKYDHLEEDAQLLLKYNQNPEMLFLAGKASYELGNYVDALRRYNQLMELDSANASYLKERGKTFYRTRIYKRAAYDLSMSLDLVPDDAEVNYYLALSHKALGDIRLSCYYMERAKRFGHPNADTFLKNSCIP